MISVGGSDMLHNHEVEVQRTISAITTPAFDLLVNRDVAKARKALEEGRGKFEEVAGEEGFVRALQRWHGGKDGVPEHDSSGAVEQYASMLGVPSDLMRQYERLEDQMRDKAHEVIAAQGIAIAAFAAGNDPQMHEALDDSRKRENDVSRLIVELGQLPDEHRNSIVNASKETFSLATKLQYAIGTFILLMVAIVASYGWIVGKVLRQKFEELVVANRESSKLASKFSSMNEDITKLNTEMASHVRKLTDAQNEIVKKGRMEQLGQLTATIAHELRNPLGSVRTSAYLINRKVGGKGHGIDEQIMRIEKGVVRCDNIITQLLDFSRTKQITATPANLDSWLAGVVTEEANKLPANIQIDCILGLDERLVPFDPARMQRAVINLISNSVEAMTNKDNPPNMANVYPKISISTFALNEEVAIRVKDNGPGIAAELMTKIREPLFTTKSFGTGLGIPAIEQIAVQHGGRLEIRSEVGTGAEFTIFIPSLQMLSDHDNSNPTLAIAS